MAHPLAIVLGVDSPIGLTVLRELGSHGVPVHGIGKPHAIGRASRYCSGFTARPAGPIADWLPELIEQTGARALLAISESDLLALAALPAEIGGCQILTPRADVLTMVLDKSVTLAQAKSLGIDTPQSWQPRATEDFTERASALVYPVIAKWADPPAVTDLLDANKLAFVKAEYVTSAPALLVLLDRYAPMSIWPLIQSYCPGHGVGQMLHMDGGVATLHFQHRRLHEWPPEGGVSTYCAAESPDQGQMAKSEALLCAIGWQGPAMVEYRYDPATGRYWLMEINGRFWGSLPLARHAGACFAWEQYRRAFLGETTPPLPSKASVRARYMIPETRRVARIMFGRGAITDPHFIARPWRELLAYMLAFVDPRSRYYVFSLADPGPMLADIRNAIGKVLRRDTP